MMSFNKTDAMNNVGPYWRPVDGSTHTAGINMHDQLRGSGDYDQELRDIFLPRLVLNGSGFNN